MIAELGTALGTWGLVALTFCLVKSQDRATEKHLKLAREQMQVEIQLKLQETFDARPMLFTRRNLANQLIVGVEHSVILEDLMNFFETVGMLIKKDYVDMDMIWFVFGYYGRLWWSACKDYIIEERRQLDDKTLFVGFELFAEKLYEVELKEHHKTRAELEPSAQEVKVFLEQEHRLI